MVLANPCGTRTTLARCTPDKRSGGARSTHVLTKAPTVLTQGLTLIAPEITVLTQGLTVITPGITVFTQGLTVLTPGITVLTQGLTVLTLTLTVLTPYSHKDLLHSPRTHTVLTSCLHRGEKIAM